MESMKKLSFFLLCLLSYTTALLAQDFSFSQFYDQPILRNPSLAGLFEGDLRVSGIFRNQWQSVTVPFQTSGLSVEYRRPLRSPDYDGQKLGGYLTIGGQFTNDVAGDIRLKRTQVFPVINYTQPLNENSSLSVAFMPGWVNSQFDIEKMRFDDQYVAGMFNPGNPTQQIFSRTGVGYWDLSTGVTFKTSFGESNDFYLGAALFHVNNPKIAFYANDEFTRLNRKYTINAGLSLKTSDLHRLIMYADYFHQGGHRQFIGGALYGISVYSDYNSQDETVLYFGGFYRWNDALIPVVKLNFNKFSLGCSYDVNNSKLKTASQARGGFELNLNFRTYLNITNYQAKKVRCVGFGESVKWHGY